jgi:hypothetical protein
MILLSFDSSKQICENFEFGFLFFRETMWGAA